MSSVWYTPHNLNDAPYEHVPAPVERRNNIEVHELQKRELYEQTKDPSLGQAISLSGFQYVTEKGYDIALEDLDDTGNLREDRRPADEIPRPLPSKFGIQDTYLYFDTDAKDTSSRLDLGEIAFSIPQLNKNNPIDNVIEMEISSFYAPDILTNVWEPVYFFYKEMTINVKEMEIQSIRAQESTRFHFVMTVNSAGISNFLTPKTSNGKYIFNRPFRDLSLMTLQFRAPIKSTMFEQDIFNFTIIPGTNPGRIQLVDDIQLPVATMVSIFIRGVATNIGNLDATLNSSEGHLTTVVVNQFTLEFAAGSGIDFTGVPAISGTMTVGFRRMGISMRFRSITNTETNYIVPV